MSASSSAKGSDTGVRRVRALINPRSGLFRSHAELFEVLDRFWHGDRVEMAYMFSHSAADGQAKARRAVAEGVDTILVIGGDGMVNSIGSVLIGTDVALGVIPTGSGNGFARHFNIPLIPEKAAQALAHAGRRRIDVGTANGRPFFVTCSLAWDAAIVRGFEKSPVRGILPYVLAGAYELMNYEPQPFTVVCDGGRPVQLDDPVVFTIANLTQFGGGARIAPQACPDDGYLELVVAARKDIPYLIGDVLKLFDGTGDQFKKVTTIRFATAVVTRPNPAPVQVDGELLEPVDRVAVNVLPRALTVLIPAGGDR